MERSIRRASDPEEADYSRERGSPPSRNGSLTRWTVRTGLGLLVTALTALVILDRGRLVDDTAKARLEAQASLQASQANLTQIKVNEMQVGVIKAELAGRLANIESSLIRLEQNQKDLLRQIEKYNTPLAKYNTP